MEKEGVAGAGAGVGVRAGFSESISPVRGCEGGVGWLAAVSGVAWEGGVWAGSRTGAAAVGLFSAGPSLMKLSPHWFCSSTPMPGGSSVPPDAPPPAFTLEA